MLPHEMQNVIIGLSIVIGILMCFFGYPLFKIILGIFGFFVGGILAGSICFACTHELGPAIFAGIVGGSIVSVLAVLLYFIGVFFMGAFFGLILGIMLFVIGGSKPMPEILFILSMIAGIVAVIFKKFMIIVSTSFGGAWDVVIGFNCLANSSVSNNFAELSRLVNTKNVGAIVICWLMLGIAGMIVQYKFTSKNERETQPPPLPEPEYDKEETSQSDYLKGM